MRKTQEADSTANPLLKMNIVRCPSSRRSQLGITSYFTKRPVLNASRFSNVFKSHSSRALRISLSSFLGCDLHSRREKTISLCLCSGGKQRGGAISAMSAKTSSASVSERMAELKQAGRCVGMENRTARDNAFQSFLEMLTDHRFCSYCAGTPTACVILSLHIRMDI